MEEKGDSHSKSLGLSLQRKAVRAEFVCVCVLGRGVRTVREKEREGEGDWLPIFIMLSEI